MAAIQTHESDAVPPAQGDQATPSHTFDAEPPSRSNWSKLLGRYENMTPFEKQWIVAQSLAPMCLVFAAITTAVYIAKTPSYRSCDGKNPLIEGLSAAMVVYCLWLWPAALGLHRATRRLRVPTTLPVETRRRRQARISWLLVLIGSAPIFAACYSGMNANLTSHPALDLRVVPKMIWVAATTCLLAGIYNICMAIRIRQYPRSYAEIGQPKEQGQQEQHAEALPDDSSFYLDFPLQTSNDRQKFALQWLVIRGLAIGSMLSFNFVGTVLWFYSACDNPDRPGFYEASHRENVYNNIAATVMLLPALMRHVGSDESKCAQDYAAHWCTLMGPLIMFSAGVSFGSFAYFETADSYGLVVLKVHSAIAGILACLASGYDVALISKVRSGDGGQVTKLEDGYGSKKTNDSTSDRIASATSLH